MVGRAVARRATAPQNGRLAAGARDMMMPPAPPGGTTTAAGGRTLPVGSSNGPQHATRSSKNASKNDPKSPPDFSRLHRAIRQKFLGTLNPFAGRDTQNGAMFAVAPDCVRGADDVFRPRFSEEKSISPESYSRAENYCRLINARFAPARARRARFRNWELLLHFREVRERRAVFGRSPSELVCAEHVKGGSAELVGEGRDFGGGGRIVKELGGWFFFAIFATSWVCNEQAVSQRVSFPRTDLPTVIHA